MLKVRYSNSFKKDYKTILKRGYDVKLLEEVIRFLVEEKPLPLIYIDHKLVGGFTSYRECHIMPDWLLVYKIEKEILTLTLTRTGTHSDIFSP